MDGWNTSVSFWGPPYFQVRTVSLREGQGLPKNIVGSVKIPVSRQQQSRPLRSFLSFASGVKRPRFGGPENETMGSVHLPSKLDMVLCPLSEDFLQHPATRPDKHYGFLIILMCLPSLKLTVRP